MPGWWRWMFYITIVFGLGYFALFPGIGVWNGTLNWTMRNQYDAEMQKAEAQYGPIFNKYLSQDVMTVAADKDAREMGHRLFLTYCAQCHGSDAKGANGFPNLTDSDWLWGGTPEKIEETITNGHDNIMPPKGVKPDMTDEEVKNVIAYERSLSGLSHDAARAELGKPLFAQACAACHGPEGKGDQIGHPNLTDKVYLYGSSEASMIETVTKGRLNRMPAWGDVLGKAKVHLLTAYVWGLGGGVKPEAAPAAAEPAAAQ
jgi:cytochrome c oxidase cbb3-type subunit 3